MINTYNNSTFIPEICWHFNLHWLSGFMAFPRDFISIIIVCSCHVFEEGIFQSILIVIEPEVFVVKIVKNAVKNAKNELFGLWSFRLWVSDLDFYKYIHTTNIKHFQSASNFAQFEHCSSKIGSMERPKIFVVRGHLYIT